MNPPPNRRRFIKILAAQSAALIGAVAAPAVSKSRLPGELPLQPWQGIVLGAEASIRIAHPDPATARTLLKRCVSEIQRLERVFSLYDDRSALSRLNASRRLEQAPPELIELLKASIHFSEMTGGCFDVTIQPVLERYRRHFEAGGAGLPTDLDRIRACVGFRQIKIDGDTVALSHPGGAVTLNGIAQGYITDRIAELLRSAGIRHTLIELGEKRALGGHPSGRPWNIALADPSRPEAAPEVVALEGAALASSGGYGTPIGDDGRVHHLVDPRTGRSVHHFSAVHVRAPTATEADALSTALAVCRPEETKMILEKRPQARAWLLPAVGLKPDPAIPVASG